MDVRLGSSSGNSAPSLVAWTSLMSPRCISEEWRVIGAFIALSWPSRLVGCYHRSVWRKPRASSSRTSGCPRPPCQPDLDGAARTVATRMGPEQRTTSPCWRVVPSHVRKLESVLRTTATTRGLWDWAHRLLQLGSFSAFPQWAGVRRPYHQWNSLLALGLRALDVDEKATLGIKPKNCESWCNLDAHVRQRQGLARVCMHATNTMRWWVGFKEG